MKLPTFNQKTISSIQATVLSLIAAAVTYGAIGSAKAAAVTAVVVAVLNLVSALFVHSVRTPPTS